MFHKIFNFIANHHISPDAESLERIEARRMNLFAFYIGFIFLLIALKNLLFGFFLDFLILFVLGTIFQLLFFFTRLRHNVLVCFISLEFTLLLIFFFSSTTGFENGLSSYYFLILMTSLFIFNSRKNVLYNVIIYITVFVLFTISHYYNFRIFTIDGAENLSFIRNQRLFSFITVIIWFAILGYFILSKHFMILELYQKTLRSEKIISDMHRKLYKKDDMDLENIVKLAMNDDIAFIPKMKHAFPDLYDNLIKINPNMTSEEFKLCALLKLGFNTKDIAEYNHLSVRTVQTRKSRLRKSFEISANIDLYKWIDTF